MMRIVYAVMIAVLVTGASHAMPEPNDNDATAGTIELMARGYDVVAFFTENQAVKGLEDIAIDHDGRRYLFANAENRAAFEADPARYQPEYSGYCAFGVAGGKKKQGDPEAFAIVDDRLFLIMSPTAKKQWERNRDTNIEKSDKVWEALE